MPTKTPYQIRVDTTTGPHVDCFRTAAAAKAEVAAINGTVATRKHGMRATYVGHVDIVGDEWQRLLKSGKCLEPAYAKVLRQEAHTRATLGQVLVRAALDEIGLG